MQCLGLQLTNHKPNTRASFFELIIIYLNYEGFNLEGFKIFSFFQVFMNYCLVCKGLLDGKMPHLQFFETLKIS